MTTPLDDLDRMMAEAFEGFVVRKDLVRAFARQYPVPTYVAEFLLGRYCATTDEEEIQEGLQIVARQLQSRTVRAGEEELFKARAREQGSVQIIDLVSARLDARTDSYLVELPSLRLRDVRVSPELVRQHERMLTGGFYAEVELEYDAAIAQEANGRPFGVASLREIQLSKRDVLGTLAEGRQRFSTEDWKRLLLRSIGLEADRLDQRQRDALFLRMVPFVERNYNMVELGPRGTGKSHLYQQVSPYAHLISGGKATVARMFVNNATGQRGLVCQYDVICFDEVSGVSFDKKDGVNIMKGYMESGEFSRGKESIRADGSIVLVGNFDVDVQHQQRIGHLLGPLPPEMRNDTAFMDRIHSYLPGWDVPKMSKELFTDHFGLVSDFLSECMSRLRDQSRATVMQGRVTLGGALSGRDTNAVSKTVSGLLKLLYPSPDMEVADEDLEWALRLALECRRRVKEQHRGRPPGARPGLGHQPRRTGRECRPVPHRVQRRPGVGRQDPQPTRAAGLRREREVRRAESLRASARAGWRPGSPRPRVLAPASGLRRLEGRQPARRGRGHRPVWRPAEEVGAGRPGRGGRREPRWVHRAGLQRRERRGAGRREGRGHAAHAGVEPTPALRPVRRHGDQGGRAVLFRRSGRAAEGAGGVVPAAFP